MFVNDTVLIMFIAVHIIPTASCFHYIVPNYLTQDFSACCGITIGFKTYKTCCSAKKSQANFQILPVIFLLSHQNNISHILVFKDGGIIEDGSNKELYTYKEGN